MTGVAVVTGGGRGIGREVALLLAGPYRVVVGDVDGPAAAATAAAAGTGSLGLAVDVSDPSQQQHLARSAAALGPVRLWVNNAGVLRLGKAWALPDDEVRLMVDVNLLGVVHGSRAALGVMDTGDIVNVASMAAFGPVPGLSVYAATKAAVVSFSLSLTADLRAAGRPVRVHALCPDTVDTPMARERAHDPEYALGFSGSRLLTAEEVAGQVVDLVGSRSGLRAYPRRRGALARLSGLAPDRLGPVLDQMRRAGEKRRRGWSRSLAG